MFKQIRMAKQANQMRADFERLWDSPTAYRPVVPGADPPRSPAMPGIVALDRLADYAKPLGATSGDTGILALELLDEIDACQSYADAFAAVVERLGSGELKTVAGKPMRNYVGAQAAAAILEAAASAGRHEAYAEYVMSHGVEG